MIGVPQPILALDVGTVFGVIFLVIAFLGWLINLLSNQNRPPPPVPRGGQGRPPRPRDDKLAGEIELFLREVAGQKEQKGRQPEQKPEDVPIEVVAEAKPRARRPVPRPPRPAQRAARPEIIEPPPSPPQQPARRRSGISERHAIDTSEVGADITRHLTGYMEQGRLDRQVDVDLPHAVNQGVREHLGLFGADPFSEEAESNSSTAASTVAALLRNPAGVRQAILINEVLLPPKSRRQ